MFEQGYIPYARIDDHVRPVTRIYVDKNYLECMYRIYAYDGTRITTICMSDRNPFVDQGDIALELGEVAINRVFNYAIEHHVTSCLTLREMFSRIDNLSPDVISYLVAYTKEVQEQASAFTGRNHTEELVNRIRDIQRVNDMQDMIRPLEIDDLIPEQEYERWLPPTHRPTFADRLKRKPNNTLVETEPTPFSDEELDTLLFEGA